MLEFHICAQELYDEKSNLFIKIPEVHLKLEHSLISLSKWEQKWHKPFLSTEKSEEEILDYIRCMNINSNVDPLVYRYIPPDIQDKIIKYIKDPMTATKFRTENMVRSSNANGELVTAETIYYWMITLNIPVEFQKWHLNQLLALIKLVSIKNQPKKKMSQKDAAAQQRMLNEQRRARLKSRG